MSTLPPGWASNPLADLVINRDNERVPVNARERARRPGKVPYYGASGQIGWIDVPLFDEPLLLVGEDGVQFFDPDASKAYVVSGPAWVNNHAHVLAEVPGVSSLYLRRFLNQVDFHGYANGTTRLKLTKAALDKIPVSVAPAAEQGRIVGAIEEAFSKLDAGEAGLRAVRHRLKRMRESVLTAAVAGHLVGQDATETPAAAALGKRELLRTQDGGGLPALPPTWAWARLGDVSLIGGGTQKQPKRVPKKNRVPFLRVANVGRGKLSLDDVHDIELFEGELDRYRVRAGDLLVVEGNGSPTKSTIRDVAGSDRSLRASEPSDTSATPRPSFAGLLGAVLEQCRLRAPGAVGGEFDERPAHLEHRQAEGAPRGAAASGGPLEEQGRIVAEVERQFSFIDAAERAVDAGLAKSRALRRSVLKAAFEGKLVPQDPTDEPASVLLERIRAERAAAEAERPARRRRTRGTQ